MFGKSSRDSCIVRPVSEPRDPSAAIEPNTLSGPHAATDPTVDGPLSRAAARALLDRGAELMGAGEFPGAFNHYRRVIGFDDPDVTAAALLGAAQAQYRMDDEAGAVATWEAILQLPETPATYHAWREIAAARVRDGDLQGAIAAYREADRRAPAGEKAEIANRLGWLAKETGNVRASRRYFARGRGVDSLVPASYVILGITVVISLATSNQISPEGGPLLHLLWLDKAAVARGEIWRLLTIVLVHDPDFLLHLLFNMYALYIAGPIVEQLYGGRRFLLFYVLAAIGGSIASFAFGAGGFAVGASGAIFGLFGILFVATRAHHPALDRRGRALVGQIGTLLVINLVFGFAAGSQIDNFAHLGGLATGALLGLAFVPGRARTLRSFWSSASGGNVGSDGLQAIVPVISLVVLAIAFVLGYVIGVGKWT
jgi:membrane associated rhomboid family serine protease